MNPPSKYKRIDIPPKMARLLARQARFYCAYGGRASGKSWSFALYCLIAGTRKSLKIVGMRETMNSIRDSSYTLMIDWIGRVPELAQHYRVEANRIFGKNGTEILFKGLKEDTASRIKSLEGVDICFVDEAQQVSQHSWDVLIPTIRKEGSIFLISWNPNSDTDPVWQEFGTGKRDSVALCEISYLDNPYCSQEMIDEAESCRAADPKAYDHIWKGKPQDQTDNQLIPTSLLVAAQTRQPVKGTGPIVLGVDPARFGDDETALVVRQDAEILHWVTLRGFDGVEVKAKVIDLAVQFDVAAVVFDVGGLGGPIYDELRRAGLKCRIVAYSGAYASPRVGFKNLRAESYDRFKAWLGSARIPTDRRWMEQAIAVHYFYDTSGKMVLESKEDLKARGGKSPDVVDACVMSLCHGLAERKTDTSKRKRVISGGSWMGV